MRSGSGALSTRGTNLFREQNGAFWYIVLRIMLLTYTRAMIRFSRCDGLSRMHLHDEISKECQNEEKQRFYG